MTVQLVAGTPPIDVDAFDSWDTFRPQQGKLWLWSSQSSADRPATAAVAEFRVVLSFGPDRGYTMAWAVDAYRTTGIPIVDRGISIAEPTDPAADRSAAERAAIEATDLDEGDVLLWCDTLLLAVRNLRDAPLPPETNDRDRLTALAETQHRRGAPTERPTTADENRDVYETMTTMGLAPHVVETMLFVLVLDDEELELSRNHVTADDLIDFARLYFLMPSWPQRCAVAYVLQDHDDPQLTDLRLDVLRSPSGSTDAGGAAEELGLCHIAKATSLAWLRGSIDLADSYLADPELLDRHAAIWAELRPPD